MKRYLIVIAALSFAGCAHVSTKAEARKPDGTEYILKQRVMATAGGNIEKSLQDFEAEVLSADGSGWTVGSSNQGEGMQSPEILSAIMGAAIQAALEAYSVQSSAGTERARIEAERDQRMMELQPPALPATPAPAR